MKSVTKENAKKAKNIVDPIRLEEVQQISQGATCFYMWVSSKRKKNTLMHMHREHQ